LGFDRVGRVGEADLASPEAVLALERPRGAAASVFGSELAGLAARRGARVALDLAASTAALGSVCTTTGAEIAASCSGLARAEAAGFCRPVWGSGAVGAVSTRNRCWILKIMPRTA